MALNLAGLPKTVVEASDISTLIANSLKGRFCVTLPLERGAIDEAELITSKDELLLKKGRPMPGSLGWYIAEIALNAGAQLYVSRAGHYTNVYDKSTVVGTKTTGNVTKTVVAETKAKATFTPTEVGEDGNVFSLYADTGSALILLGSYTADVGSDTDDDVAAGLRSAINALTGTHSFTAAGSGDDVDITAPTGSGAAANSYILKKILQGTSAGTIVQFAGGISQVLTGETGVINYQGKNIGPAYNATITTQPAASGNVNNVDIIVTLAGYDKAKEEITDVPRVPSAADITAANGRSELIKILTVTTRIPYGTVTLSGGTYDHTLINDNDVIGASLSGTGMYAFNKVKDAGYFVSMEYTSDEIDYAMTNYCSLRQDMRAFLKMPFGLTIAQSKDYRNKTGNYAGGVVIDSFWGKYIYGDVGVTDSFNSKNTLELSGIGFECGARAKADNNGGEWISCSGEGYSHSGIKYLLYDYSESLGLADDAYENANGINPIINHPSFGFVTWGNRSLLRDRTKLTSKENIANLMVPVIKFLKLAADKKLFKPNDPITWNELYREAKQFIITILEAGRAIRPTENDGWYWVGDQNVDSINDIKFNIRSEIDAGKYRIRFIFQPIAAIEYIGIEATATDGANLQVAVDNAA